MTPLSFFVPVSYENNFFPRKWLEEIQKVMPEIITYDRYVITIIILQFIRYYVMVTIKIKASYECVK